jgi:outer membrane lipoprotein-sorting protein
MRTGIKLVIVSSVALVLLRGLAAYAAPPDQKDLKDVLHQLDVAAVNFHSTSADVERDSVQTDPIYDKDVQKGVAEYKRNGKSFQMAVHFLTENGKPNPKDLTYSGGKLTIYEKLPDQVHVYSAAKFESYLLQGFGASGAQLAEKWDITYLGAELMMDGSTSVKTAKLELVAKDPDVRKMLPKVTIWVDPSRAVSLKQVFDQGQGQTLTCYYSNIKLNPSLPDSDFAIKTDSNTQIMK